MSFEATNFPDFFYLGEGVWHISFKLVLCQLGLNLARKYWKQAHDHAQMECCSSFFLSLTTCLCSETPVKEMSDSLCERRRMTRLGRVQNGDLDTVGRALQKQPRSGSDRPEKCRGNVTAQEVANFCKKRLSSGHTNFSERSFCKHRVHNI